MQIVEVELTDWSPAEKNQRVEELPEGVRVFDGDAVLVNEDRETVAVQLMAGSKSSSRLAWFGREMHKKPKVWHDSRYTANASSRLSGVLYPNRTFGTAAPSALRRRFWCSSASFDLEFPKIAAELRHLAVDAWAVCEKVMPEAAEHTANTVYPKIHDDWLLFDAPWTSGIINKSAALPYHRDSGNIKGAISAMWVVRSRIKGGYLHIPEYNVAFTCPNKSLIAFDGQRLWHGVTPFETENHPDAFRFSVVYYAKTGCQKCGPAHSEAERAQLKRTEEHETHRDEVIENR
jgi:hypothetical protein